MAHSRLCGVGADKYLPEDLWLDILSKLSVQSVLRCRCVCKTWHHIIGTTSFVETHLAYQNSSSNTNKYIFYGRDSYGTLLTDCETLLDDHTNLSKLYYTPRSFGKYRSRYFRNINGICNGLFCLSRIKQYTRSKIIRIHLWNPICRKVKNLPKLVVKNPKDDDDDDDYDDYDTSVSFGYHDDDYKVIVVIISDNVDTCIVSVYSLQTNSWKTIRTSCLFDDGSVPVRTSSALSTSFVHGTAYMLTEYYTLKLRYIIICFSLSDETIRAIAFPEEFSSKLGYISMEVYDDTIAVLGSCTRLDSRYLEMWILRRSKSSSSWENKFSVKLQTGDRPYLRVRPLGFLNNGKYLFRTEEFGGGFALRLLKLWWCDLESEFPKLTEFDQHDHCQRQFRDLHAHIHSNCVESLLLLNEDSVDPFVHTTEMESSCSSSISMLLVYKHLKT